MNAPELLGASVARDGWDAIVVGAGPAGSTTAALLAAGGARVLVLERDAFPRFHVGESLLPVGMAVLERLGVEPDPAAVVPKRGARFLCERTGRERLFCFSEALPGTPVGAWQVDRAKFDALLRDRARAHGATVVHGAEVLDADADAECAWAETRDGRYTARYLVDATGLDRLSARRHRTGVPYRCFGSSAAFTHFEGLSDAAWDELVPHFDVQILVRDDGWGWIIPLAGRRLSVGLVSAGRATVEGLEEGLLAGPTASRLTRGARRLASRVVGNFSFRNTRSHAARFAAVGDAACFLDPVFSSGVTLALRAGESVADRVAPALAEGREADPDLLAGHAADMDRAYRTFEGLIHRFYNTRIAEQLFLGELDGPEQRAGVLSVLAGDVWRTDNPFQELLLRGRRVDPRGERRRAGAAAERDA